MKTDFEDGEDEAYLAKEDWAWATISMALGCLVWGLAIISVLSWLWEFFK